MTGLGTTEDLIAKLQINQLKKYEMYSLYRSGQEKNEPTMK